MKRIPEGYTRKIRRGNDIFSDHVYTVKEFRRSVAAGCLIDYDGYGHPVVEGMANPDIDITPSCAADIPKEATHILWLNR